MEISAVQAISDRYGAGAVTLLSPFPEMDRPFYQPTTVEKCNRRNLIMASIDLLRGLVWRGLSGLVSPGAIRWLLSREMKLVEKSNLVIDLSGDMLTEDYGPHVAYSHYIPILRALILGKPYFLCAQSIGPFKLTMPLARLILNRAAAITPRDRITLDYLKGIGIENPGLEQTADLAFLLEPAPEARTAEILKAENITLGEKPVLGISVSQLIESKYGAKNPGAGQVDFVAMMKTAIEAIARQNDAAVLFVSHVTGPSSAKDDRIIAERVNAALDGDIESYVLKGDYRPDELKGIIRNCTVFCGARMHANIGALSSFVPTVAISYSHKTPGIMAECGVPDFVVPVEEMTSDMLREFMAKAFDGHDAIVLNLKKSISDLRKKSVRNIDLIEIHSIGAGGSKQ